MALAGDYSKIDRRRKPAIEAGLLIEKGTAPLERAEIEKTKSERLLDLVGVGPGQEDDRDVCLADLHHIDGIQIGGRVGEGGD